MKKIDFIKVWGHKHFEWQFDCSGICRNSWFHLSLDLNRRCDHAGIHFNMSVGKMFIELNFYDNRHWDDEIDGWKISDP